MITEGFRTAAFARKTERMSRLGLLAEPMGYVDGPNLYEFVHDGPISGLVPSGLGTLHFGDQDGAATQPASGPSSAASTVPSLFAKRGVDSVKVTLADGETGVLKITWKDFSAVAPKTIPGAQVRFDLIASNDNGCYAPMAFNNRPNWRQTVTITIDNAAAIKDQKMLRLAMDSEIKEHGGNNPFLAAVGDNGSGDASRPYPFQSTVIIDPFKVGRGLYSTSMWDTPHLPVEKWPTGTVVTKAFVSTLYSGNTLLLTIKWKTTQTAGDPSRTTVSGDATWGK